MLRKTNQRSIIAEVVGRSEHPLSVPQLLTLAQEQHPTLGIATVYRTLKALVESGDVKTVEWPGEPPRYERAGLSHHHHFNCRTCRQVFDVDGCVPGIAALAPKGFEIESHEILLFGRCQLCKEAS